MKHVKAGWIYSISILVCIASFFFDKHILEFIVSLRLDFLDTIFIWITHAGSSLVVLFIMTTLFLYEENKRRWILPLWITLSSSMIAAYALKIIVARARPDFIEALVETTTASFPSGHTLVAFAALPLLDKEFKKLAWFWLLFAGLVGLSRLYVGAHYLSDVVAGGLIGYLIGRFVLRLEEKYKISRKCLNLN